MIDNKKIYQVDTFTNQPFKGNPAGVMILDNDEMTTEWMQNIAAEMNLSETAFVMPFGVNYSIRYFTPTKEVRLCGHATLASAHVLYEFGIEPKNEILTIHAKGGILTIEKIGDEIQMKFPEYPLKKIELNPDFQECLGFEPIEMYESSYDWVIAVANSEEDIINATPKFDLMMQNDLGHLMITAKSDADKIDFVSRCFAPISGINEDPVTGSAHCALTPLWAKKLEKKELNALQVSQRTGYLKLKLKSNQVLIQGQSTTIFEATLKM